MIRTTRAIALLALCLSLPACDADPIEVVAEVDETYGFESGGQGWVPLTLPGAGGTASATVSSQQASEGSASMRLSLSGPTGTGAVYVTRRFTDLAEDRAYDVGITFDLGSEDTDPSDAWSLRAGAGAEQPGGTTAFQSLGSTEVPGEAFMFEERALELVGSTGPDGELWITVGVAQAGPGDREYYLDGLRVTLTRR